MKHLHRPSFPPKPVVPLASLGGRDGAILILARHVFQSFACGTPDGYRRIVARAARLFPPCSAQPVASDLLATIETMRRARRSCFHFSNPACSICSATLTDEERLFISVFGALSDARVSAAHAHALLLCEGNDSRAFLLSMQRLAATVGAALSGPDVRR